MSLPSSQPADSADESGMRQTPTASADAVYAEQRRIAQALHDTVSQSLTGIYLQATAIARRLERDGSEATDDMARLVDMLHQTVLEMREITHKLTSGEDLRGPGDPL